MRPIELGPEELDLVIEAIDHAIYQCFQWINTGSLPFEYDMDAVSDKVLNLSDLNDKILTHFETILDDEMTQESLPKNVVPFQKEER